ncbi:MAG: sulfatase [Planctomycetaceae bacterium]|nr:sulfatase [Planctomycetaceae bacterium]
MIDHKWILAFILLAISNLASAAERPNILFIYADDQSHRTVSCYPEAYDWMKTPHIDQLAKNGVRFAHAYIGTWCMPSRATMLTGHHQFGIKSMRMEGQYPGSEYDPKQCRFWPSVFRANGYTTAQIGKWHTGTDTGYGRDWDYQIVWNRPRHVKNAGAYFYDQLLEINGAKAKKVPGYSTDNYTKWADEFIRGEHRDADKPWFLWVCYGAVHGPFTPAKRHLDAFPGVTIKPPADIFPPRPGKPKYMQFVEFWVRGTDGKPEMKGGQFGGKTVEGAKGIHGNSLDAWVRQYHQGVLGIDDGVGQLVKALKESGQLDNTLIVYTADQGMAFGQKGFCRKIAPYDGTIRAPMIVSLPSKIASNKVCDSIVGGCDIMPTFFSFAGIDLPWKVHGHDLSPLLKNPEANWPHPTMTVFTQKKFGADTDVIPENSGQYDMSGVPWWVSLAKGRYKYIRNLVKGETEELYDLRDDPEELTNLALDPRFRKQLTKYRKDTVAELKRTDAKMVKSLPPTMAELQ